MNRGGRTCQVIDLIYFGIIGKRDIVPYQFKKVVIQKMLDIPF